MNHPRHIHLSQHTRLRRVPLLPELQLHLADDVMPLWRLIQEEQSEIDVPLPYWAFAWVGGQAVARYLLDHPAEVAGMCVVDFAAGSGLCAIAAMKVGAARAVAVDIDAFSEMAVAANAQANGVAVDFSRRDLLDTDQPEADLLLAGDIFYDRVLSGRALDWLRAAHDRGTRVLIGDPGRAYFPSGTLVQIARYAVPTTLDLEDKEIKPTGVFTWPTITPPVRLLPLSKPSYGRRRYRVATRLTRRAWVRSGVSCEGLCRIWMPQRGSESRWGSGSRRGKSTGHSQA